MARPQDAHQTTWRQRRCCAAFAASSPALLPAIEHSALSSRSAVHRPRAARAARTALTALHAGAHGAEVAAAAADTWSRAAQVVMQQHSHLLATRGDIGPLTNIDLETVGLISAGLGGVLVAALIITIIVRF